jgi:hypothetical protein
LAALATAGAGAGALLIERKPAAALAIPLVLATAALVAHWPAPGVLALVLVTGSYASIAAFTGLRTGALTDVVLGGLWVVVLWRLLLSRRDWSVRPWPGLLALLLFLALTALQLFSSSGSLSVGLRSARASHWFILAFVLLALSGFERATLDRIARGVAVVALVVGAYAVVRLAIGPAAAERNFAASFGQPNLLQNGDLGLFGSFVSRHQLGAWCALMIPFCAALALGYRGRWRLVATAASALCAVALLGSQSRIGLVATVAGLLLVLVLHSFARAFPGPRLGALAAALITVAVIGGAAFSLTIADSPESTARYELLTTPTNDPSYLSRVRRWNRVLEDLRGHPGGLGLGSAGGVQETAPRFVTVALFSVDGSYLKVAYEQGLWMMALFIGAVVLVLLGLARRALAVREQRQATVLFAATASFGAFLVLLVAANYIEGYTALLAWLLGGLGAAHFTTAPDSRAVSSPL